MLQEVITAPVSGALLINVDCIFCVLVKLQYFWFIILMYSKYYGGGTKPSCAEDLMLEHELWGEEGPGAGLVPSAEHLLGISKVNEFSF